MEKEYQPTRREVLGEVWNGVRSKFTKENLSKTGEALKDFSGMYLGMNIFIMGAPYVIPSLVRASREHINLGVVF